LEQKRPLHVDNICHVAEERTIINRADGSKQDKLKKGEESFSVDDYTQFKIDNKALLDEFLDADWEKSHEMLHKQGDVLMEENAKSYYMLTCLDEQMKGNTKRAQQLGRQGQLISQIYQLAEPMKRPPRDLVPRFFERFDQPSSRAAFQEGVDHFMQHIEQRAIAKKKEEEEKDKEPEPVASTSMNADAAAAQGAMPMVEMMYKMTPKMRKSLAPEGIDPVEVYEQLPAEMKAAFKESSTELLNKAHDSMNPDIFNKHFSLCIDSGLWEQELNAFVHIASPA